jgi:cobalt-zinc-cadmium efflux system outer membrane protein
MLFTLRSAFVQTLEAKAVLELAKADLEYYDKIIDISKAASKRAIWRRSIWTASSCCGCSMSPRLRRRSSTCARQKIALLQLLNDRTPVDQFDVVGPFDFPAT